MCVQQAYLPDIPHASSRGQAVVILGHPVNKWACFAVADPGFTIGVVPTANILCQLIGPSWVSTLRVQVMDRARVIDERVTMRCTGTVYTTLSEGCLWELWLWMALRNGQKGKLFFCQCSSHFWNLPCVYPCVGLINESYNIIWIPSPE